MAQHRTDVAAGDDRDYCPDGEHLREYVGAARWLRWEAEHVPRRHRVPLAMLSRARFWECGLCPAAGFFLLSDLSGALSVPATSSPWPADVRVDGGPRRAQQVGSGEAFGLRPCSDRPAT